MGFWSEALEAEFRAMYRAPDGSLRPTMPRGIAPLLLRSMAEASPAYDQVRAPALAFYAVHTAPPNLAAAVDSAQRREAWRFFETRRAPYQREERERFRRGVACGRVIEFPCAHHFLFVEREDEVVRLRREFLAAPPPCV